MCDFYSSMSYLFNLIYITDLSRTSVQIYLFIFSSFIYFINNNKNNNKNISVKYGCSELLSV